MDNFLTDRDYREEDGIDSLGRAAIHFELFRSSLEEIMAGAEDHDPAVRLHLRHLQPRPARQPEAGRVPIEIEPADIVFIEGNFPFLIKEVVGLIGIKVVYLTDDAIRLKRKWKRDIDYARSTIRLTSATGSSRSSS